MRFLDRAGFKFRPSLEGLVGLFSELENKFVLMTPFTTGEAEAKQLIPEEVAPQKSASMRLFLCPASCRDNSRYYVLPAGVEIASDFKGEIKTLETEVPEYVILDTANIEDQIFMIRIPADDRTLVYAIDFADDKVITLKGLAEYDAFLFNRDYAGLVGVRPGVYFDQRKKEYHLLTAQWRPLLPKDEE